MKDKKLCNGCGILSSSKPCNKFKPNTNEISTLIDTKGTFQTLATLILDVPDSKLRLIGAAIMREHVTRSCGFHMGQKIYVRYRGQARSNYMSNFMSAFVLYADADMIRVTSRDGKCCMTFSGTAKEAIYSNVEFQRLKEKMVKAGRFVDPDAQRLVSKRIRCEEEYELGISDLVDKMDIPTIDRVFKENKVKKSKSSGPNDLVAIVNAIESGFEVKPSKTTSSKKTGKTTKGNTKNNGVYSVDVNS